MGGRHGGRSAALDRAPVLVARERGGRGLRGRAVREARPRGRRRDGGAAVLVRERAARTPARVLLRDAARRTADSEAMQARRGGCDLSRTAPVGLPRAVGGPRSKLSLAA